jgi:hypothetical protein
MATNSANNTFLNKLRFNGIGDVFY